MAKKKSIPWQCRQGDVFLERIDPSDAAGKVVPRENRRIVLAHGEATGHAHVVERKDATLYEREDKSAVGDEVWERLLRCLAPAELRHDCPGQEAPDHNTIPLPAGDYVVVQQLQYSPAEIVPVRD